MRPPTLSQNGCSALHLAAQQGREGAIRALLTAGASTAARCRRGLAPLHYAALRGKDGAVHVLRRAGAAVDAVEEEVGAWGGRSGEWGRQ